MSNSVSIVNNDESFIKMNNTGPRTPSFQVGSDVSVDFTLGSFV